MTLLELIAQTARQAANPEALTAHANLGRTGAGVALDMAYYTAQC